MDKRLSKGMFVAYWDSLPSGPGLDYAQVVRAAAYSVRLRKRRSDGSYNHFRVDRGDIERIICKTEAQLLGLDHELPEAAP